MSSDKILKGSFSSPSPKDLKKRPGLTRRQEVIALRKQNLSIYDISRALKEAGTN